MKTFYTWEHLYQRKFDESLQSTSNLCCGFSSVIPRSSVIEEETLIQSAGIKDYDACGQKTE